MAAINTVALDVDAYSLTTTPNASAGVSASLTSGRTYLVIGIANAANTSATGTDNDLNFRIGATGGSRTVFARAASETGAFAPSAELSTFAHGGSMVCAFAATHTPGAGEELELQAWAGAATGEAAGHAYALDVTDIPGPGTGDVQARWHAETANSDATVDTPADASGYNVVGDTLTATIVRSGSYLIVASAELLDNGTGGSTDEFDVRLTVDGVAQSGTTTQCDVSPRGSAVRGYLTMRVVSLSAGSHDVEIEVSGTSSQGTVGVRRIRVHLIEVAAFESGDVQQAVDAGETVTGLDSADPAGHALTIGNGADSYLAFAQWQKQVSYWAEGHFLVGGTPTPTNGFGSGTHDFGVNALNDIALESGITLITSPATSTALGTRINRWDFFGSNNYGADAARAVAGDMVLIAIRLSIAERGPIAANLLPPAMVSSGAVSGAGPDVSGATSGTMIPHVLAASALVSHSGSLSSTVPIASMLAAANTSHAGGVATSTPLPTMASAAVAAHAGVLAVSTIPLQLSASGSRVDTGSASLSTLALTMAASGSRQETGAVAAAMRVLQLAASGSVSGEILGNIDADTLIPLFAGTGLLAHVGDVAASMIQPSLLASGSVVPAGPDSVGDVAASLLLLNMSAAGATERASTLAASLLVLAMASDGTLGHPGVMGASTLALLLSAVGASTSTLSGAMASSLPVLALSATGSATGEVTGAMSVFMPLLVLSASQRRPRLSVTIAPMGVVNSVVGSSAGGNVVIPGER